MGKSWFGTQPASKPYEGPRIEERGETELAITGAEAVALLTTAEGLERWLAAPTRFSKHRGGTMEFTDGDRVFGGSFALLDVPERIVIVTELHGEIDVRLSFPRSGARASVTMTCVAADEREVAALQVRLRETTARLIAALGEPSA